MTSFVREYSNGLTASVIGHALLVLIFSFNLIDLPFTEAPPVQLAIEATVIDMEAVREKQQQEKRRQMELERQRQAAAAERRKKAEAEQRRQTQQRLAEQKRIAEEKRRAEQARKQAEQQRIAEEKRAEEKRRAEEARLAEQKRRQAEIERQFQSEIAAEEARLAAIASGKLQQYIAAISARVTRNWVEPASARPGIECEVSVAQIPGGEIVNVRIGRCNGDAAVIRSIEAAVYRSSPLPPPPDPSLFERNLRFMFKPEE